MATETPEAEYNAYRRLTETGSSVHCGCCGVYLARGPIGTNIYLPNGYIEESAGIWAPDPFTKLALKTIRTLQSNDRNREASALQELMRQALDIRIDLQISSVYVRCIRGAHKSFVATDVLRNNIEHSKIAG